MNKEELLKLNKKQLITRCLSMNSHYQGAMRKHRELKGDILIIKKQIQNIAEGIQFKTTHFGAKSNRAIKYCPGGKNNRKVKEK